MIRVLLVDDSSEILEVLKLMFQSSGRFEVVATARNSEDALTILAETSIDLISVDIMMGQDNGLDLCRNIRRQQPNVFISMCSAEPDDLNRELAVLCGAQYFLSKPVRMEALERLASAYQVWEGGIQKFSNVVRLGVGWGGPT